MLVGRTLVRRVSHRPRAAGGVSCPERSRFADVIVPEFVLPKLPIFLGLARDFVESYLDQTGSEPFGVGVSCFCLAHNCKKVSVQLRYGGPFRRRSFGNLSGRRSCKTSPLP